MDWEQIWYLHWQEIYRFIFYRVRDRHEAEDLIQETFIRAMQSRHVTSAPALLKTIARNLIIDRWRKNRRLIALSLEQQELWGITAKEPVQMLEVLEQQDELQRAMENLTTEQREVLTLRLLQGLPVKETAEKMGKSEGAVKSLQYRALTVIREQLGSWHSSKEEL